MFVRTHRAIEGLDLLLLVPFNGARPLNIQSFESPNRSANEVYATDALLQATILFVPNNCVNEATYLNCMCALHYLANGRVLRWTKVGHWVR